MLIRKAYRYRVYPTAEQERRLLAWQDALRQLWNLAHEQRLHALSRVRYRRVYLTAFDQHKELTALRKIAPWIAEVPRNVCAQLLVELDRAWQRCFKRLARQPRFKRKGRDSVTLCEPHPKVFRLTDEGLRFPKLGLLKTVIHRPIEGKPKTCSLVREVDQWFACVVCEVEIEEPKPRTEPRVALDRGVINIVADNDGRVVPATRHLKKALRQLAHAQRTVARRKKGSNRKEKAKQRVARLHRKVRRQRAHVVHQLSREYANSHGTVVIERLNTKGMVLANSGLARGILDAGWAKLAECLRYKLAWSGGRLLEVPAAYSSQECSACGCVDRTSRRSQAIFHCVHCGHLEYADINAAKNLLGRANRSALPVEGSPLGTLRSGKAKVELRVPRRSTSQSLSL